MVHIIPLFVGERRLDTGNAVQYPDSSPVGEAMQQLGDRWQAAAERYEQRKVQQEAFDTEIAARRLNGQLSQAEADTVANSPADGAGLHDAMYGQVNPYTGQVVKTGLFDTMFGNFLKQAPPELRAGLAASKEAFREAGSIRMALQQNQRRKQYEQDQVAEVHTAELRNIAQSDPNDTAAFDASRQAGLDLLAKMDLDPQAKAQAEADWLDRSAKTRVEALIAKNPQAALNLFGLKSSFESNLSGQGVDGIITGSARQPDTAIVSGEKEDRIRKTDPSERVGQAFQDNVPIDVLLAQLSPESYGNLVRQARSADAASFISMHTGLNTDAQKAKAAIANMEPYSGSRHDDTEFAQVFGAEEGGKRSRAFNWRADVSPYVANMRVTPTNEVDASIFAAKPVANRFSPKQDPEMYKLDQARYEQDQKRHELNADAAALVIQQRQVDPAGYARRVSASLDAALKDLSTPQNLQAALAQSFAAQRQLGIAKPQPLPRSDAEGLLRAWGDSRDPEEARRQALEGIVDPKWRKALAKQLDDIEAARPQTPSADGVDSSADSFDDVDSERPAKFAKSIYLSPADILRLKKTVATEYYPKSKKIEAEAIIDAVINRLPAYHWGNSIESVVNAKDQYSDVNGPVSRGQHNRSDIDQVSIDDPRFARASAIVDEYLQKRASGALSSVGDHLSYGNPDHSSEAALKWLLKFNIKRGLHLHGTPSDLEGYRPGNFSIELPTDYYPSEP